MKTAFFIFVSHFFLSVFSAQAAVFVVLPTPIYDFRGLALNTQSPHILTTHSIDDYSGLANFPPIKAKFNVSPEDLDKFISETVSQFVSAFSVVVPAFIIFGIGVGIFHWFKNVRNQHLLSQTDEGCLINAAGYGDVATVKSILNRGIDVNSTPRGNQPALFKAIKKQHVEAVKLLLESGADGRGSYNGETALWLALAAGKPNKEIVRLLLANGADINDNRNPNKKTPLQVAKGRGDIELVELLTNGFYKD